jgi:hypothetical protein
MERSQVISGVGHAAVVLWVVLGDWLFAPTELPPPAAVQVSMVTSDELAAMDAAAASTKPEAVQPEVKKPANVKPLKKPAPKPAAEKPVAPPKPADPPPEIPVAELAQPDEAPPATAPIDEVAQPLPVPETTEPAKPKKAVKILDAPSNDAEKLPEVVDVATPEISDQPSDLPQVEDKPAAAPEETAQTIVPEAEKTDAPELAPTKSVRPQSRPDKPVKPEEPVVDPQIAIDAQAEKDAKAEDDKQAEADAKAAAKAEAEAEAQAEADAKAAQDAVDAALADATAEDAPATDAKPQDGGQTNIPEGPPMSSGEIDGIRVGIGQCWSTGTLSTAAEGVALTLRVEMNEDGTPIKDSITMTNFTGGDEAAAQQAFEAARRAVMRGVKGCGGKPGYQLDPAKYGQWNVMNLHFDNGGVKMQ